MRSCGDMVTSTAVGFCFAVVAGVQCVVPLLFSGSVIESGMVKVVVYSALIVVLLVLLCFARPRLNSVPVPIILLTTVWGCVLSASWLWNCRSLAGWASVWREVYLVLWSLIVASTVTSDARRSWMARGLCCGALAVGGYAVAQRLGIDPVVWSQSPCERVFSTLGNPNMLATYCVGVLPLMTVNAIISVGWWRWGFCVCSVVSFAVLLMTQCRGSLFGLALSLFVAVCLYRRDVLLLLRRPVVLCCCTVAVFVILGTLGLPVLRRFGELRSVNYDDKNTDSVRLVMWRGAWLMFLDHPVIGVGPGCYTVRFPRYRNPEYERVGVTHNTLHAHNEILEVLADTGILGLVSIGGVVVLVLSHGVRVRRVLSRDGRLYLSGLIVGVAGLLGDSLFGVSLRWPTAPFVLYQYLGLIIAFGCGRECWRVPRFAWAVIVPVLGGMWWCFTLRPFQSEVFLKRGVDLQERGEYGKAMIAFEGAIRLWPPNCRARYNLAHSLFKQQRYDAAEVAYLDLQRYSPDYAQIHWNLAAVYLSQRRWDKAAEEYIEQQQIGGLPNGYKLETLLQLLVSQGSADEKYAAALRQLIAMKPDDEVALNMLGNHCFRAGRFDEAATHYGHILAIQPKSTPALNNLAGVYFMQGNYARARATCLRIVALPECSVIPWLNLAKANLLLGDLKGARAALAEASKRDPGNVELPELRAMLETPTATPSVGPP